MAWSYSKWSCLFISRVSWSILSGPVCLFHVYHAWSYSKWSCFVYFTCIMPGRILSGPVFLFTCIMPGRILSGPVCLFHVYHGLF